MRSIFLIRLVNYCTIFCLEKNFDLKSKAIPIYKKIDLNSFFDLIIDFINAFLRIELKTALYTSSVTTFWGKIKQDGRLAPAYFSTNYKIFDQLLQTVIEREYSFKSNYLTFSIDINCTTDFYNAWQYRFIRVSKRSTKLEESLSENSKESQYKSHFFKIQPMRVQM